MAFLAKISIKKVVWIASILSILLTILATIVVSLTTGSFPKELPLAMATAMFSFAAIPLFIMARKDFKHGLRRAYTLLCVGIILYGIGQLQFPLFEIIDGSIWVDSGAVVLPYLLSAGFLFFGVRHFAKLIGLKGLLLSPWLALVAGIAVAAASGFFVKGDEATTIQLEIFLAVVLSFPTATILKIRSATAERYHKALAMLAASFGMQVFAGVHYVFMMTVLGHENAYVTSGLPLWPVCLAALFFMGAGYSFAGIRLRDSAISGSTSPVDVITYVASLASNPSAIDTSLDTLRGITATLGSATVSLSKEQEKTLARLYKDLEQYLITNEPLQQFTKADLREKVRTRFQFNPNDTSPFWSLFAE